MSQMKNNPKIRGEGGGVSSRKVGGPGYISCHEAPESSLGPCLQDPRTLWCLENLRVPSTLGESLGSEDPWEPGNLWGSRNL
jgi:hypothetical protein